MNGVYCTALCAAKLSLRDLPKKHVQVFWMPSEFRNQRITTWEIFAGFIARIGRSVEVWRWLWRKTEERIPSCGVEDVQSCVLCAEARRGVVADIFSRWRQEMGALVGLMFNVRKDALFFMSRDMILRHPETRSHGAYMNDARVFTPQQRLRFDSKRGKWCTKNVRSKTYNRHFPYQISRNIPKRMRT